ncbi:MAG: hypothetical protein ACF8SC_01200 [Phycisphaerales bacterium JB037]
MHGMTKFLVVVAAVLSVVLATLSMAYTANADRLVRELRDARAAEKSATAQAQATQNAANDIAIAAGERAKILLRDLEAERGRRADLQAQLNSLQGEVTTAELARDRFADQFTIASQTQQTQADLLMALAGENNSLRSSESQLRRELASMTDERNNYEAQVAVLTESVRALRVTIAQLQDALAQGPGAGSPGSGSTPTSGMFSGRVQDIRSDSNSEILVELNLGTNDSVRENTELYITRGNNWIANVQVLDAQPNYSIARVTRLAPGQRVNQGDTVESRLN